MADFPLGEWFDLSKPISRDDREICEAQMALYALKQGDEPWVMEAVVDEMAAALRPFTNSQGEEWPTP